MRPACVYSVLLGLAAHYAEAQCNNLQLGHGTPNNCIIDPNDGSNYGVYAYIDKPCNPNEVLYLSLSYTAPDGYITRTETSAQIGTASPFITTFTFDIPNTFFAPTAVITQTFQIDNSAPAAIETVTRVFSTTNFVVPRVSTSTKIVQSTLTYRYTATYSDYVTIPHTTTLQCNTGVRTGGTVTTTFTQTDTAYTPDAVVFTPSTTTLTQTVRCTLPGGGLPNPLLPRSGEYETVQCLSKYNPASTSYSTGAVTTSTTTSTLYLESNILTSAITTITFSDITQTECNRPTATVTYTSTKVVHTLVTPTAPRSTITSPSYVYKYATVAKSQC